MASAWSGVRQKTGEPATAVQRSCDTAVAGSSTGIDGHARGEPRPRSRSLCVTLLDSLDHEPGVSDDRGNVAREVTSVGESTLEWFEPTLPDDDPGVGGKAVLEKIETTSGTNHASQFQQRAVSGGDAAEGERRQCSVAAVVGEGNRLTVETDMLDRHPGRSDAADGQAAGYRSGLNQTARARFRASQRLIGVT